MSKPFYSNKGGEKQAIILFLCLCAALIISGVWLQGRADGAQRQFDVKVTCPAQGGPFVGSGTIVASDEKHSFVLTAWHVVRERQRGVVVHTWDRRQHRAQVLAEESKADLAMLAIGVPKLAHIDVGNQFDTRGRYYLAGFPLGKYSSYWLTANGQIYGDHTFGLAGQVPSGISGGRITNQRGELVGVVSASVGSIDPSGEQVSPETFGACGRYVKQFVDGTLAKYTQCRGGACQRDGSIKMVTPYVPQASVLDKYAPKPTTCKCASEIKRLETRIAHLEQELGKLQEHSILVINEKVAQAVDNLDIPAGVRGPQGPAGPPGRDGHDGKDAHVNIDDIVARLRGEVTTREEPFYLRVHPGADYQEVWPGSYVTLPLSKAE